MAAAVFGHVNVIARDWRRLSRFYEEVFGCVPVPPQRNLKGRALEDGTGVPDAAIEGQHLRLPGLGPEGPTLEIYSYPRMLERPEPAAANRMGLAHLAFQVEDVGATLGRLVAAGGRAVGRVVSVPVAGKGTVSFVYAADPEDNIVELQSWSRDAGSGGPA